MSKMITGAVALESGIYRAGQEDDLATAAAAAAIDLTDARFADALSGDWSPAEPKAAAKTPTKGTAD